MVKFDRMIENCQFSRLSNLPVQGMVEKAGSCLTGATVSL
jgi:hypothetical protein